MKRNNKYKILSLVIPSQSITKIGSKELRPYFLTNSLERLKDPKRGATGISWSEYPEVDPGAQKPENRRSY